ncbi:hypothetical protein [Methylocystis heyeri]|uniref:Uncharacterized protein n=1 Tax=Methylocystis heyeri TaxID=391905 RepID=A0A6B8KGI0_9HYPH|nr:hypothetical protein [Methylocystis heyeri]QGM46729.1 hypothetical protein H2LOC_014075 [Methylocystis heyeri]
MFRYLRGLALLAALGFASPALAITCAPGASCSLTQGTWTDLGAGPLQVNNTGLFQAQLAVSTDSTLAAAPSGTPTTYLGPGGVAYFSSAAHVWAQASGPTGATILASAMATPATPVTVVNPRSVTPDTSQNDFHATSLGVTQLHNDIGAAATGVSPPSGGTGLLGWLSGIYQILAGTAVAPLSVTPVSGIPSLITPSDSVTFPPPKYGIALDVSATGAIKLGWPNGYTRTIILNATGPWTFDDGVNQIFVTGSTATFVATARN